MAYSSAFNPPRGIQTTGLPRRATLKAASTRPRLPRGASVSTGPAGTIQPSRVAPPPVTSGPPAHGGPGGAVPYPGFLSPQAIRHSALQDWQLGYGGQIAALRQLGAQDVARYAGYGQAIQGFSGALAKLAQQVAPDIMQAYQAVQGKGLSPQAAAAIAAAGEAYGKAAQGLPGQMQGEGGYQFLLNIAKGNEAARENEAKLAAVFGQRPAFMGREQSMYERQNASYKLQADRQAAADRLFKLRIISQNEKTAYDQARLADFDAAMALQQGNQKLALQRQADANHWKQVGSDLQQQRLTIEQQNANTSSSRAATAQQRANQAGKPKPMTPYQRKQNQRAAVSSYNKTVSSINKTARDTYTRMNQTVKVGGTDEPKAGTLGPQVQWQRAFHILRSLYPKASRSTLVAALSSAGFAGSRRK